MELNNIDALNRVGVNSSSCEQHKMSVCGAGTGSKLREIIITPPKTLVKINGYRFIS